MHRFLLNNFLIIHKKSDKMFGNTSNGDNLAEKHFKPIQDAADRLKEQQNSVLSKDSQIIF